ncbi:unnamed protein product [Arctia plantaginis]|uniref:Uncharacterized protein n=1 Tax=Arctia plantaginis TaxID=874455 RepID=A0A8S1APM4_ARCPL|nr:unnamed protein product [Arctia plantaginis]
MDLSRVILKAKGLFEIVEGSIPKPGKDKPTEYQDWISKDSKAQGWIVFHIEQSIMTHLLTATTSAEMWTKLNNIYEKKSSTSLHLEQQKFYYLKCDTDISLFFSKIEEIRANIRQLGDDISDKMVITKVLMSLPEKYRHFIAAWESVPTENQTVGELMARLLIEEERNMSISTTSVHFPSRHRATNV